MTTTQVLDCSPRSFHTYTHMLCLLTHTALSIRAAGHARRADAHKGADLVFAGHASGPAVIETFSTLILV